MRATQLCACLTLAAAVALAPLDVQACTGITLKAKDGAVVYGRTMEWGSFDLHSRLVVVPRGYAFVGHTPDGKPGLAWKGAYGAVGLDAVGKDILVDGINEVGLTVGAFYHPGVAAYAEYDPAQAARSMACTDLGQYLLTTCAGVKEVREALATVRVVAVVEPALGIAPPLHLLVTEPSGAAVVVEFLGGVCKVFEAPLGVITNAPSYDWHETNLRNYVNLSPVALPSKKLGELDFSPLGSGSGMIGLPGDFTPPSRFVRAVAFTKTARPTADGAETTYELFRILDNFNLPLGPAAGTGDPKLIGMRSSSIWTTAYDTKARVLYYHTQHNRRVRRVDLAKLDFAALPASALIRAPLDKAPEQDIEDRTPAR